MLSQTILPAVSRAISITLPAPMWYRAGLLASALFAFLIRLRKANPSPQRFEQAILLNRMLAVLTRSGKPFPVPWRLDPESAAILNSTAGFRHGVIMCSAHLPLVKVAIRALMETGRSPSAAIAAKPGPDGRIAVWGLRERVPALKVQPNVLLRARTELRNRGTVLLMVDTTGGDYSPNIFRLARATGSALLFVTSELQPDGYVAIRVFQPPFPACQDQEEITANLLALDRAVKAISGSKAESAFDSVPARRLT